MGDDAIRSGSGVCFAVAILSGLVAGLVWATGLLPAGAAMLCLAEAGLYVALGVGIRCESRLAGYAAALLYTGATVWLMSKGLFGFGMLIRLGFTVQLWRAVFAIDDLKAADRLGAARRAALEADQVAPPAFVGPRAMVAAMVAAPPAPFSGPRPAGRRHVPGGVLMEPAALEPKRRTGRPSRGVRTCWSCRTDHAPHLVVCPTCRRDLFDA